MKLLVWVQAPYVRPFLTALQDAAGNGFLSGTKNARVLHETRRVISELATFASQAFWEMLVNAVHLLPLKLIVFRRRFALARRGNNALNIYEYLLTALGTVVEPRTSPPDLGRTLSPGRPLLVVANHPFPPIDALSVMSIVQAHRPDFSVLSNSNNSLISIFREYTSNVIELHMEGGVLGTKDIDAIKGSRTSALRKMMSKLRDGECIVMFPAGQGSKALKWGDPIEDVPWMSGLGFLVEHFSKKNLQLEILPIFIEGHMGGKESSELYQHAVIERPNRLPAVLQRALFRAPPKTVVHIGDPLPIAQFKGQSAGDIVEGVRNAVYRFNSSTVVATRPATNYRGLAWSTVLGIVALVTLFGAINIFAEDWLRHTATDFVAYFGWPAVFATFLATSVSLVPLPDHAVSVVAWLGGMNTALNIASATAGSVVGAVVAYVLGSQCRRINWVKRQLAKMESTWRPGIDRFGSIALIVACASPIPDAPFFWLAGAFRYPLAAYLLIVIFFRMLKITYVLLLVQLGVSGP